MLDKMLLIKELDKLALNFSVDMKEGYTGYMLASLNQYGFTDDEFLESVNGITRNETSLFARMPNVAMFLKYRPEKVRVYEQYKPLPRPEISDEDKNEMINALDKLTLKLKIRGQNDTKF